MALAKENRIISRLIFLYLLFFPFGQLARVSLYLFDSRISFNPTDLVALTALLYLFTNKIKFIKGHLAVLLAANLLSLAIGTALIGFNTKTIAAFLYFLRLIAYMAFAYLAYLWAKEKRRKNTLSLALISVAVVSAVFGWYQYWRYPDLRDLVVFGWDDHLYRLTGTFMDPGFTSIILVFGILALLSRYFYQKNRWILLGILFLGISLGFTYSRAGFLALLAGSFYLLIKKQKKILILILIAAMTVGIALLPRKPGEGTKLERVFSIELRKENFFDGLRLWGKSPLFGFGYNNLCPAKAKYFDEINPQSHSCSGFDSSSTLLLSSIGLLGMFFFLRLIGWFLRGLESNYLAESFTACLIALAVHSQFTNSLFYPWVMGWMGIYAGLAVKRNYFQ